MRLEDRSESSVYRGSSEVAHGVGGVDKAGVEPGHLLPLPPLQAGCFGVQVPLYVHRKHTLKHRSLVQSKRQIISSINRSYGKRTAFIQCFTNQWPLKALHNIVEDSPIHTPTAESATQGGSQGHLVIQLGGAGDRTSNLQVASRSTS